MLKVLLIAPTDPETPGNLKFLIGGDNTYTRTLLKNPPKGVKYIHHLQALKEGRISYLPIQKTLSTLVKFRVLPLSGGSQCFKVHDTFDLVHCHSYSIKIAGAKMPIILSDSSSNYLFLRDYINWPEWRIAAQFKLRKWLFDKLEIHDPDTNLERVSKLIVFSKFARDVHLNLGASKEKVVVVSPGLPKTETKDSHKNKKEIDILFVGIWFERKGGPLLLKAFKSLSQKYPNLKLTIVGPVPKSIKYQASSIKYYDFVPRERLMREFFPQADIFVLVPPKAEGYGFVVEEAASFGIPSIVSRVYALPKIVENGKTGFVIEPGNLVQLLSKLEILITDAKLRRHLGRKAKERFERESTIGVTNKKLLKVYRQVLENVNSQIS